MKKQIVLAVLSLILCISGMAEITPAHGQQQGATLTVSPPNVVASQPITFTAMYPSAWTVTRWSVRIYRDALPPSSGICSAVFDLGGSAPIANLNSTLNMDTLRPDTTVTLTAGLPAGLYDAVGVYLVSYQNRAGLGTSCNTFIVSPNKPVPEFNGIGIVVFLALAASLYILRRRQVKIQ